MSTCNVTHCTRAATEKVTLDDGRDVHLCQQCFDEGSSEENSLSLENGDVIMFTGYLGWFALSLGDEYLQELARKARLR